MDTRTTNLRNRPEAEEYADVVASKGSGQLNSINAYLQSDPVSYFYQKLKSSGNEFLRDDYWSEAAQRGESENLAALLNATNDEKFDSTVYNALAGYGDRMDFDAYMLALQLPHLSDDNPIDRIDEATGTEFGKFSDKAWGMQIVKAMMNRWDAEIIENDKANRGFLADVKGQLGGATLGVLGGISNFLGDVWNLGEGILYLLADWNNESNKTFLSNRGEKFLKAFDNDEEVGNMFASVGEWLQAASFEFQRQNASTINAVRAYEEGYVLGEGNNMLEQLNNSVGVGAGYTTWGRWMNAGSNAIGYMVPTIVLGAITAGASAAGTSAGIGAKVAAGIGKARAGIFYAGIFSGMMKENVTTATLAGISYKDLNSGQIIANAAIKSVVQYSIERALGLVIGFSGVDRLLGMGGKVATKAGTSAASAASAGGAKAVANVLKGGLKGALKEGLEETLQELSDIAIDYAFGGSYQERAIDNFTPQTLTDAFVVGALSSAVMGSMANVSTFLGANRGVGQDASGQTFKMGAFQSLSLKQAMQSMQQWRNTINDANASLEKKAAAMLSLNAAISTLGDVYRNMGTERATMADTVIMDMLNMQDKVEQIKAMGNAVEYSNKLWTTFTEAQANAANSHVKEVLETKIKKAIEKESKRLKDGGVNKISDVVTAETDVDNPNTALTPDTSRKLKALLTKLGVEAIVGVNGGLVVKSGDVLFADKNLVNSGSIENIIKGVALDLTLETVKANLNKSQTRLIVRSYGEITGLNGSIDDAVIALLFDKQFYTHTLLRMKERKYQNPAFEVMITLDKLITSKLTPNIQTGTVTEAAYKIVLNKVRDTMRSGLIQFATNYNKLDLGLVDNAVLPAELKQIINEHKNVKFTDFVNDGLKDKTKSQPSLDRMAEFNKALTKYETFISKELSTWLRRKAASTEYNDRVDAYTALVLLSKNHDQTDKVVYLPMFEHSDSYAADLEAIDSVEKQFGVDWKSLVDGTYDVNLLTPEIQDFIKSNGYNMANAESRRAVINEVLFHKSGKTLTLGSNRAVLKVVPKADFMKAKYLEKQGHKTLYNDIKSGKVKTLGDVAKIPLDSRLINTKLTVDNLILQNGMHGATIDGQNEIMLSNNDIINTLMHELTHLTQAYFEGNNAFSGGGNVDMFNLLPNKVKTSLLNYIQENFPISENLLKGTNTEVAIMYFMLAGELQASTTLSSMMFETGFKWADNKRTLVSPDGTTRWSMDPSKQKTARIAADIAKQAIEKQAIEKQATEKQATESAIEKPDTKPVNEPKLNENRETRLKNNPATFKGKHFWIGSVNLLDGVIEETHTYETAKAQDFHHTAYFTEAQLEKMNNEENAVFWINNGKIEGDWRTEIDADIIEKIKAQIKLSPIEAKPITKAKAIDPKDSIDETKLSPLPKGLSADEPLTIKALNALRDDPAMMRRMEKAWLKREDGTPMVFYRGWKPKYSTTEIHLANDGNIPTGIKVGEFYSADYTLSKKFGSKLEGFVSTVTRAETKVYDFKGADWLNLKEFYTPTDLKIHNQIYKLSRPFTSVIAVARIMAMGKEIESAITSRLDNDTLTQWNETIKNLMTEYGVSRDNAVTALSVASRWETPDVFRTDELLPINILQGYKAVLMNDVNEVDGVGVSTNLALLRGTSPIKVTHSQKDINWNKVIKPEAMRYISNEIASKSNLAYFKKKGVPIQMNYRVANFVSRTTDDFDKLPKVLKDKIIAGQLNLFDILYYTATANYMNTYTFQAISKYVFHNEAMSKLTFKESQQLADHIVTLAALAKVVDTPDLVMTVSETYELMRLINKKANTSAELGQKLSKATNEASAVLDGNSGKYVESFADPMQLLPIMMRHYNGSLTSLQHVNNFGKLLTYNQVEQRLEENSDTGELSLKSKEWNWLDKIRKADIQYEQDPNLVETLEDIDIEYKIEAIKDYITNELISRVNKMTDAQKRENAKNLQAELQKSLANLENLTEEAINKRYLAVLANETESSDNRKLEPFVKPQPADLSSQPRSSKNIKDHLRQAGRTVTARIAGLKRRYNSLPKSVQDVLDPKTFKLKKVEVTNKDGSTQLKPIYHNFTEPQLETLTANLKEAAKRLNASIKDAETKAFNKMKNDERVAKMAAKELKGEKTAKKTLREKVGIVHNTKIINQVFEFDSRETITQSAKKVLDTQWTKRGTSKVKGLSNNTEQNVHNGKLFFEHNTDTLLNMSTAEAEATVKWFMDANIVNISADSTEAQTYAAIKTYLLGYILGQSTNSGQFANFNTNLKNRLENYLRNQTSVAGTLLAVWNNVQGLINPIKVMMSASMEIAGVILSDSEKENLLMAAVSKDMKAITEAQQLIIERVHAEKTTKKTILRKLTTLRSMSMLSNPVTWLRNKISNFMLLRLNKVASIIGNQIASNKTIAGQFKMTGVITPAIQSFINDNFIDNKMFDTLVSKLSRYNPSDIQMRFKDATGKANQDAIFANMVIKSLYNEFYNQNLFQSKNMNKLHGFLMKMLSDNNYVREASIRYFGKIIAERGYALDKGVTDAIMNDFAVAIGHGMADYMHSDNFFNQFETMLAEKSEVGLFAFKLMLPFGSASWNWFKAAVRFSPVGLAQSLYKLSKLEQQVIKAEAQWAKGKGQLSPELTEYLIRRDIGSGVIGTMSMLLGMMLAGLGYVELEDDDYGVPKLRIGNLRVDISTIFGSSSVLAGMALVKSFDSGDYMAAIDAMAEPMLDGFFLINILEMDKYNNKGWASLGINFMEQTLLSFIPNGLRWISGATYTGKYKTNTYFERAVARIPFFGSVFGLEKRVNPYTGELGNAWDMFNRVVPFFEVRQTSFIEDTTKTLGINKAELRGNYEINGEKFELAPSQVAALNKMYGQWNADALTEFYDNRTRYSVKMPNGSFRELTYNQMTEDQRRNAVQNIFSKNAEYAKISAWLEAGNAYYASATDYMTLKKLGITGALYKGNKGFTKR